MSDSKLVSYKKISPNRTSPRNHVIDTVSIHCYVGQVSVENMAAWLCNPDAQASANYAIGSDGRIALIVPEADRSWCTSNKPNDHRAITIECASDSTNPYAVNDNVMASLINLLVDICQRNNIDALRWRGDKSLIGQTEKQNMTVHRWFAAKACPGDYLYNRHGQIAAEVNARLNGANTDAQEGTDKIWLGWVKRESGSAGFRQTNGDSGNAYGKYQFDRRYALVPFMQFCVEYSQQHYSGFQPYIAYGAGSAALKGNTALAKLWTQYCDKYPTEFEQLQDTYAYQAYYLEGKKYIDNLYGIRMDNHSPALKGSLFSMAIRSGSLSAARKFAGCTDQTDDATMINKSYATYSSADAGRWTKTGQWGDALKALETGEYTEVKMDMEKGDILPDTNKPWLRVRKTWTDAKSQLGAFHELEKAKTVVDKNPGYYVFDEEGKTIYPEKKTNQQIIDAACAWAVGIANDNSHGYNNAGKGWGPEYNCIGLVTQAYNKAGLDLGKVSIDKMAGRLLAKGFLDCTGSVNFKTGAGLQKGDILLMLDQTGKHGHTELCLGGGKVVGARNDDDGRPGDGTGHEIAVSAYFNYNWQRCFHLPGAAGTGGKKYRVQAGAYEQKKLANQQIARLKNKGFEAILKKDGEYHIVQAGVFDSKENAEKLKRQLKTKGFDAIIKEV